MTVADLDRSLQFYSDVLGLRVLDRGPLDPELVARMTGLLDADVEYADVELGTRTLELLCHRTLDPRPGSASRPERADRCTSRSPSTTRSDCTSASPRTDIGRCHRRRRCPTMPATGRDA